jgi:hypothetical protein
VLTSPEDYQPWAKAASGPVGVVGTARTGRSRVAASINACDLGVYPDRETAVNRVEELIESEMRLALQAWELYTAWKKKNETYR